MRLLANKMRTSFVPALYAEATITFGDRFGRRIVVAPEGSG